MKRNAGFTLIELITTIVISALLLAIGIPSFRTIIQNNRAATLANSFISYAHLARSEAIKRGLPVTMCASANQNQTACGSAATWNNGWLVFVDPDGDGTLGNLNDRIKIHGALDAGSTVTTTQGRITYAATGFVVAGGGAGNAGSYTLAAQGCYGNYARAVSISNTGRVTVSAAPC